jgi:hypothetical protein
VASQDDTRPSQFSGFVSHNLGANPGGVDSWPIGFLHREFLNLNSDEVRSIIELNWKGKVDVVRGMSAKPLDFGLRWS